MYIKVKTKKCAILFMYIKRRGYLAMAAPNYGKNIIIKTAHGMSGHSQKDGNHKISKLLGFQLTRELLKTCDSRAMANYKQKTYIEITTRV